MSGTIADMSVVGHPPAKLLKALAVIASDLHQSYDADGWIAPGKSKESCILASLTVRDFLKRVGFKDAACRSVCMVVRALKDGEEVHSLGTGHPEHKAIGNGWDGHLVVVAQGFLIDATVYQMKRPPWPELPGMIALPLIDKKLEPVFGLPVLSGIEGCDPVTLNNVDLVWLDRGDGSWRTAPDCERDRRAGVVARMVRRFGEWKG